MIDRVMQSSLVAPGAPSGIGVAPGHVRNASLMHEHGHSTRATFDWLIAKAATTRKIPQTSLVLDLDADNIAASDGSGVTSWTDASPAGNNAAEATNYPDFYNDRCAGKCVYFNGSSDRLGLASLISLTGDFHIFTTYKSAPYTCVLGSNDGGSDMRFLTNYSGNTIAAWNGSQLPNAADGSPHYGVRLYEWARSGSTMLLYENGVYLGSGTFTGTVKIDDVGFCAVGGGDFLNGPLKRVVIYSALQSAANAKLIRHRMMVQAGIK